ncbi:DUF5677 domain-containing protein [Methylomonas albis]|uniref:Uncharacterized protein n=1 Tax=Methylomonas albis TaxID=1854563 RepID=A0ABR9D6D3_9GAMM|nr:DUF5677 domain-containing protein [Methylomonas albis]MBD9357848.1 hypothetical protein [Methylomonas albis]
MNNDQIEKIAKIFCSTHNISIDTMEYGLKWATTETYAPFLLFIECLDTKCFQDRNNPIDGFFIDMIHRSSNSFGSMITLIANGHLQDAEISARTLSESTLKIQSLLTGNVVDNISNYLAYYYSDSMHKNGHWKSVADTMADSDFYNSLIKNKNEVEDGAKSICKAFIESIGGIWPAKPEKYTIYDIYKKLDREVEYQTVYRAMCGQSHQNPEDLINSLLYSLTDDVDLEKRAKSEKHSFSIFICLWSMRYFLETMLLLGKYFKFNSVIDKSTESLSIIEMMHHKIQNQLAKCEFPDGWTKSTIDGI